MGESAADSVKNVCFRFYGDSLLITDYWLANTRLLLYDL